MAILCLRVLTFDGAQTVHEMSVATGIMNVLHSKLSKLASCRLTALQLSLGELSGIDRDSLCFALDTLLADADYNGVEIRFELTPATFKCSVCNWQGRLESFALTCPECAGQDLDIIAGQDVTLEGIEVE
ncbi:MAG: hypothetical protein GWP14_02980 [Actinobacteria bacterium]|nr:hypothetical protein [Actinomycetota bacterium]